MKVQWCWRCQMDIPMLDETEFARIQEVLDTYFYRRGPEPSTEAQHPDPAHPDDTPDPHRRVLDLYHEMTGFEEAVPGAVMHHRPALYGPPCHACGKPLRTRQAHFFAACGAPRPAVALPAT